MDSDCSSRVRPKLIRHAPSIRAALIQFSAFLFVLGLALTPQMGAVFQVSPVFAPILQGGIAALASRWFGLAGWWQGIQFFFPASLVMALSLQLPPVIFLVAFIFSLGLYWSTFRTQVPFYPSGRAAWEAVSDVLPVDASIRFIDIGSGFGGLVLHLARRRPESGFVGIELAPVPWMASVLRGLFQGSRARFARGDYDGLDLASYDVVFAYLSPAAMPALWEKARGEMRPGALLLSYEFPIPGIAPDLMRATGDGGPVLYGWYARTFSK